MAFFLGSWLFSATRCAAVLQRICNGFAGPGKGTAAKSLAGASFKSEKLLVVRGG
jgi:hypothetical protein